ncbi:hypothetical protein [Streptomyces sp. NPDC052036]|uniref:hypothetical protein n=1 Tax=Streptomyces sp. NPDC052036 TaxID=3155171 RepID=UPI00343C2BBA
MDALDAQGLGFMDRVGGVVGPGAPLLELAVPVEEGVEEGVVVVDIGQVDGDGLRLRAVRPGFRCAEVQGGAGLDGGALGVRQGCRTGAHVGAVDLLEGEQGLSG